MPVPLKPKTSERLLKVALKPSRNERRRGVLKKMEVERPFMLDQGDEEQELQPFKIVVLVRSSSPRLLKSLLALVVLLLLLIVVVDLAKSAVQPQAQVDVSSGSDFSGSWYVQGVKELGVMTVIMVSAGEFYVDRSSQPRARGFIFGNGKEFTVDFPGEINTVRGKFSENPPVIIWSNNQFWTRQPFNQIGPNFPKAFFGGDKELTGFWDDGYDSVAGPFVSFKDNIVTIDLSRYGLPEARGTYMSGNDHVSVWVDGMHKGTIVQYAEGYALLWASAIIPNSLFWLHRIQHSRFTADSKKADFAGAITFCIANGQELATIKSANEQVAILREFNQVIMPQLQTQGVKKVYAWLGGVYDGVSQSWYWLDDASLFRAGGLNVKYTAFAQDQPTWTNENVLTLWGDFQGRWNNFAPRITSQRPPTWLGYPICQSKSPMSPKLTPKRFTAFAIETDFPGAIAFCLSQKLYLATIKSPSEQAEILAEFNRIIIPQLRMPGIEKVYGWLGGTYDDYSGNWYWLDGSLLRSGTENKQFTAFAPSEPSLGGENVLTLWGDYGGLWNDFVPRLPSYPSVTWVGYPICQDRL